MRAGSIPDSGSTTTLRTASTSALSSISPATASAEIASNFNDQLDSEQRRFLREGLDNEAQLAVFDLLQKESLTKGNREMIKKVAGDLLDALGNGKLRIDRWKEKATAQAQIKAEIIKHLFANLPGNLYNPDEIDCRAKAVYAHILMAGSTGSTRVHH